MKKKVASSRTIKKYQNGSGQKDAPKKKVGAFRDNKTGMYEYTSEYNTPAGKRYYSATSPDYSMANQIADFKARTQSKDSIPSSNIMKNKKGGTTKAKDGKWIQKATASIKRRGTEGKCTPITKKGCSGKAKTLALTFKKMAKARKGK